MKLATIGGISVRLSHTLDRAIETRIADSELILTHVHTLTDDNLHAQYREILDHLWNLGIELNETDSSSIYTVMYKLLELQTEIAEPAGAVTISFVFTVKKNQRMNGHDSSSSA